MDRLGWRVPGRFVVAELVSLITLLSMCWFYVNQPHGKPCLSEIRRVAMDVTPSSGANSPA